MKLYALQTQAAILMAAIFVLASCKKEDQAEVMQDSSVKSHNGNTFYGPAVPIGNGVARTFISEDSDGNPTMIGIRLSEKALENLPDEMQNFVLVFPRQGATDFYTHALMDWNPNGHEPPGTYDLPHFDFHFYIIPNEDRLMIGPDDLVEFANAPAPQYIPPNHIMIPGGVPQMGAHWVDLLSPEFNGGGFSRTFIWGSYDGSFIFWEPMITMEYLLGQPDETIPIPQPDAYEVDGWYAMDYKVSFSSQPGEYMIALTNLTYKVGE